MPTEVATLNNISFDFTIINISGGSNRVLIDGDGTLAGVAHTSRVIEVRDIGVYEVGGIAYLGADILVEVIA